MIIVTFLRKPLATTVALNSLQYGTGGINVDSCRVSYENDKLDPAANPLYRALNGYAINKSADLHSTSWSVCPTQTEKTVHLGGRWPANLILTSESIEKLDGQSGVTGSNVRVCEDTQSRNDTSSWRFKPTRGTVRDFGDTGGASRFFKHVTQTMVTHSKETST